MKKGDLVKIKQEFFDSLSYDIINEEKIYIIEKINDDLSPIPGAYLIIEIENKTYHYMQERYLITLDEIRKEKIKRII